MQRRGIQVVAFLIVFTLLLSTTYWTVSAGAFTYTTGFQVQNLSTSSADITIIYYDPSGSVVTTINDTIPASGSKTYFPIHPSAGFNGSAAVASTQPVAAVTNVLGNSGAAGASYVASSAGSTTVYLPLLMKNNSGFNTWFNVQNVGTTAANVTVNYSDGTVAMATVQPGASHTFDQAAETHSQAVFSAVVNSSQPVVATVIEESSSIMFAYTGFTGGSVNPVMPLINANNSGYITGVQIQNIGSSDTTVTVSYTPSQAGTACTETQTIPAGQSKTFALGAFAGSPPPGTTTNCVGGQKFIGSAQVTSNSASQNLVAIVNQLLPGVNGEAYGSFDPSTAGSTAVLPLIMDRNSGWFTGFNVMNVGTSSTTVTCTFTGTSYSVNATLNPGQALTDIQQNKISSGYVGSGTCTATGSGQIVAVVNELGPSSSQDQLLVYEGVSP